MSVWRRALEHQPAAAVSEFVRGPIRHTSRPRLTNGSTDACTTPGPAPQDFELVVRGDVFSFNGLPGQAYGSGTAGK